MDRRNSRCVIGGLLSSGWNFELFKSAIPGSNREPTGPKRLELTEPQKLRNRAAHNELSKEEVDVVGAQIYARLAVTLATVLDELH